MRIAVISWSCRKVGGVETYIETILPELSRTGHEIGFWYEVDEPSNQRRISLPDDVQSWCVVNLGVDNALRELRNWQPDLLYSHGLLDPDLEAQTLKIAPAVFFAHSYYGACISGSKTFKRPDVEPCTRPFGWRCLVHYYVNGCGGNNPATMLKMYGLQSKRLEMLPEYKAILTGSEHMKLEYIKYGLKPTCVHLPITFDGYVEKVTPKPYWQLLFLGRMENLKGGELLLNALPQVKKSIARPLKLTLAGDGPARSQWEQRARQLQEQCDCLDIEFTGWVNDTEREALFTSCDLLVVPSVWPEPFGLVGPEAGLRGIPVAAFDVGGISDWLSNGINGHLASGNPPKINGLAEAIIKCLYDPLHYRSLCQKSIEIAFKFNLGNHLNTLIQTFEIVREQTSQTS